MAVVVSGERPAGGGRCSGPCCTGSDFFLSRLHHSSFRHGASSPSSSSRYMVANSSAALPGNHNAVKTCVADLGRCRQRAELDSLRAYLAIRPRSLLLLSAPREVCGSRLALPVAPSPEYSQYHDAGAQYPRPVDGSNLQAVASSDMQRTYISDFWCQSPVRVVL
eukprot:2485330-Rhodomonas_salina.1